MTLEYLVIEYLGSHKNESSYKRISKEIDDLFITLNVDPILFKEGKTKKSPWNFPESCKEELLSLIKLLDTGDKNFINIRQNDVKNIDLKVLSFCIDTVCKILRELGNSEETIQKVKTKMLDFTGYSLINVMKSVQELMDDFYYMYQNDEDNLNLSEHRAFQKYAESEIRKLQEQLRFTYYSMNSEKEHENMLKISRKVKQINNDSDLMEYLHKRKQVNKKLFEEFGKLRILTSPDDEEIRRRKDKIEIELFGEKLNRHKYVKYILESSELRKELDKDGEYQKFVKERNNILNKKLITKSKIERVATQELKMLDREREISQKLFGHKLISPIEKKNQKNDKYSYTE